MHFVEEKDAVCQLCGQPGGPVHLITECPATRSFWQDQLGRELQALPFCSRGFRSLSTAVKVGVFIKHLRDLTDEVSGPRLATGIHLFTDGSTLHGNKFRLSLSSWSLVLVFVNVRLFHLVAARSNSE